MGLSLFAPRGECANGTKNIESLRGASVKAYGEKSALENVRAVYMKGAEGPPVKIYWTLKKFSLLKRPAISIWVLAW